MPHHILSELLHRYGDAFVFAMLFAEAACLPLPGETVMIAAALYAAKTHNLQPAPLLASAFAGALLGQALGFAIGRSYGLRLLRRFGPRIGFTEDRQLLGHYLMQRNGALLVLLSRNIPVLRSITGVLAGANKMSFQRFIIFSSLGAAVWTGFYCLGVYKAGSAIMKIAGPASIVLGALVIALMGAAALFIRHHEKALIAKARAAATQA